MGCPTVGCGGQMDWGDLMSWGQQERQHTCREQGRDLWPWGFSEGLTGLFRGRSQAVGRGEIYVEHPRGSSYPWASVALSSCLPSLLSACRLSVCPVYASSCLSCRLLCRLSPWALSQAVMPRSVLCGGSHLPSALPQAPPQPTGPTLQTVSQGRPKAPTWLTSSGHLAVSRGWSPTAT